MIPHNWDEIYVMNGQHLCGNLLKKISVSYLKVCEGNDELMCGVS